MVRLLALALALFASSAFAEQPVQLGSRPFDLLRDMEDGPLKTTLQTCTAGPFRRSDFSIGHRGAPLHFPEHTKESYEAAARMGAGILECDVTFTKDRQLVCRHAQCDLYATTNILEIPELAAKCSGSGRCCASDLSLAEFKRLRGIKPGSDLRGTVMTHAESIQLFKSLGVKVTPELKEPEVAMPFDGTYTRQQYAQQMIDEYKAAGIAPADVFAQSFHLDDVLYWIAKEPAFGAQAVYLQDPKDVAAAAAALAGMARRGVKIVGPPIDTLLVRDAHNRIGPSAYAAAAQAAGLDIVTWTLERGRLRVDADPYTVLDVMVRAVGVRGVFSDWPATTTFYANCLGLN